MVQRWADNDHDLLIQLCTLMDVLREEVRELSRAIQAQNTSMDERLRVVEATLHRYPLSDYDQAIREWRDFRSRIRAYGILLTTLTAVTSSAVASVISGVLR